MCTRAGYRRHDCWSTVFYHEWARGPTLVKPYVSHIRQWTLLDSQAVTFGLTFVDLAKDPALPDFGSMNDQVKINHDLYLLAL